MAFENKKNMLKQAMEQSEEATRIITRKVTQPNPDLRKTKSYTLKQSLANELAERAILENRSASNFLEHILEEYFKKQK